MATITEVYEAIKLGEIDTVEEYLESFEEGSNAIMERVTQLLYVAIDQQQLDIVKLLINYNANPENYTGWALIYARTRGNIEIINYLKNPTAC
jgi:hypothetical protein